MATQFWRPAGLKSEHELVGRISGLKKTEHSRQVVFFADRLGLLRLSSTLVRRLSGRPRMLCVAGCTAVVGTASGFRGICNIASESAGHGSVAGTLAAVSRCWLLCRVAALPARSRFGVAIRMRSPQWRLPISPRLKRQLAVWRGGGAVDACPRRGVACRARWQAAKATGWRCCRLQRRGAIAGLAHDAAERLVRVWRCSSVASWQLPAAVNADTSGGFRMTCSRAVARRMRSV